MQRRKIGLAHVGEQPDRIDAADGEQLRRSAAGELALHLLARVHRARDHAAVELAWQQILLGDRVFHRCRGLPFFARRRSAAENAQALERAFILGPGPAVVVLGIFEVTGRAGLLRDERGLPLQVVFGRHQVGARLHLVGECAAHVGRNDGDESGSLLDLLAQLGEHASDSSRHW